MEIVKYSPSAHDIFLRQIEACEWDAAKFLASLIKETRLETTLGGWAELYLLTEGNRLVSFLTLSAQDCIAEPEQTPWLGFFYTFPAYRGHRYGKILIDHAEKIARERGYSEIYLATDEVGLYEKYGFTYLESLIDVWGEDSRIYKKSV